MPPSRTAGSGALLALLLTLGPTPGRAGEESRDGAEAPLAGSNQVTPSSSSNDDQTDRIERELVIRAVSVDEAPHLDGVLDEPSWQRAPAFDGFVQQVPDEGAPATERTEVRVVFTRDSLYFGVVSHYADPTKIIANELRRDYGRMHLRNDTFGIILDTFHDHRNGFLFYFNALGARSDWACIDEGRNWNQDWDPVWDVATHRFSNGFSAEVEIPFKSLRYRRDGGSWGINLRRIVLHKNEWSHATPIPASYATAGIGKLSSAAELVGLSGISEGRNLELTPFVVAEAHADVAQDTSSRSAFAPGIDVKYGFTPNTNLDLTVNTDFSHVEVDEQQINLTRFGLFFPEKRAFFQEGRGIFDFGLSRGDYRVLPFFSRRIGLESGRPVSIRGGGRLTGKLGPYSVGWLGLRTGDAVASPATTFSVVRLKRDVFRRSSVGVLWTDRRSTETPANGVLGFDANMTFFTRSQLDLFWVQSTPAAEQSSSSHRTHLLLENDALGLEADWLVAGDGFDPGVGFVQRRAMDRRFAKLQVSPRPGRLGIRKIFLRSSLDYILNLRGHLETRIQSSEVELELDRSDFIRLGYDRSYEALETPFRVAGVLPVAPGIYSFDFLSLSVASSPSRDLSGTVSFRAGGFFDGQRRDLGATGLLKLNQHFFFDVNYATSDIRLSSGALRTHLAGVRANVALNTRLFGTALVQWNNVTHELGVNARLRYTYRPGSDLHVVLNERRAQPGFGSASDLDWLLQDRSLTVKWTYLFRI